ncbi:hypothetical protein P167DRAFT_164178 [Morchella conica CCBAS932]|uniref:Uncharacterized protein n=1 Tax=Morchella conica CCBAS932 TaxID=1392247 RepID=A0A3N4K7A6_9PEZI|nr:hypothetical protein P167DRAFT_164178 [Morchella conica CCBAS932]
MSVGSRMSFTAVLRNSRPYRNHDMLAPSTMSLATSQRRGAQWSTFSIGSNTSVFSLPFTEFQLSDKPLAEEPIIYNIVIPMKHDLLHNRARYPHSDWLQGLKRGVWVESDIPYLHHLLELDDPKLFGDVIPKWTETCKPILYFYTRTWVAMFGGENLMKALLDSGADPNSGFTLPLIHAAVRGDNEAALRVLLAAGADRTVRDADGLTCLALAIKLGRAKIAAILSGELEKVNFPV